MDTVNTDNSNFIILLVIISAFVSFSSVDFPGSDIWKPVFFRRLLRLIVFYLGYYI